MRIAALSDIHAAGRPLRDALAAARAEGFDALLILGDLLTYGTEPEETLDLVADAIARDGAILLVGNHDQIYLDLADGDSAYAAHLPGWLREAIEWTAARVPAGAMRAFDWRESWGEGPLFAAHANAFAFGDWSYVNGAEAAGANAGILAERGFAYGVFGHTHRARHYPGERADIVTLASLGQPRDDADRVPRWAMIEVEDGRMSVSPRPVAFDRDAHLAAIRATNLSAATQDRLCGYFA